MALEISGKFGKNDATYIALGKKPGIRELVDIFYDHMEHIAAYATIWSWHTGEREVMRDKLALFLCMWSGGPKTYLDKYGSINIPKVHAHLQVTQAEVDQWLACMTESLKDKQYPDDLREYLIKHLSIPAERIRQNQFK